jgi:hypothetical protein
MSKYSVIVKTASNRYLKYSHVNDVYLLSKWLDRNFNDWTYFNVFSNKTRLQVANFTKYNKPEKNVRIIE